MFDALLADDTEDFALSEYGWRPRARAPKLARALREGQSSTCATSRIHSCISPHLRGREVGWRGG